MSIKLVLYKNRFLLVVSLLMLFSCSKTTNKSIDGETPISFFYQKELHQDGFEGRIDSIKSMTYAVEKTQDDFKLKELIAIEIKSYNENGYIISHGAQTLSDDRLISAQHTLYIRDSTNLKTNEYTTYMSNTGLGTTIKYNLIERADNEELWEYIRKMPNETVKLSAEIRKFSSNEVDIYSQIGNTDSTTLKLAYIYNDENNITDLKIYQEEKIFQHVVTTYNPLGLIENTILYPQNPNDKTEKMHYEYRYDKLKNPIEIKMMQNDVLIAITENDIFYKK